MKIEMGESLIYSWLRHVKGCQIVQTNWKPSQSWELSGSEKLQHLMDSVEKLFLEKYNYNLFKNNSLSQLLMQAEIDAVGISIQEFSVQIEAVEVAFHEAGLQYGGRNETIIRILKKLVRSAMCVIGYFGQDSGELVFTSPKIHSAVISDLEPALLDLNALLKDHGYGFSARVIANSDFNAHILQPILVASDGVSNSSELFMRAYQLLKLFENDRAVERGNRQHRLKKSNTKERIPTAIETASTTELKVGKIANNILRKALETGTADDEEVTLMQEWDYSRKKFHLNYPLLVAEYSSFEKVRYYAKPVFIFGKNYYLCSQWFEVPTNNDRPHLLNWLKEHGVVTGSSDLTDDANADGDWLD